VIIRIFSVLALTLLSFSFSPLAEAHPVRGLSRFERAANRLSTLPKGSSRRAVGDNVRQLGLAAHNFLLRSDHEYPWQVGINRSRGDGHKDWIDLLSSNLSRDVDPIFIFPHTVVIDFTIRTTLDEELTLNFAEYRPTLGDDGDLDLYLVNAPGGDNSFRFGGFLAATSIPEPSTLALVLFATLCVPFRRRCVQSKNG